MFPVLPGKADAKTALVYITDVVDCILLAANMRKPLVKYIILPQ
jgi:hypothetical protein